jgi:hypothetical protein
VLTLACNGPKDHLLVARSAGMVTACTLAGDLLEYVIWWMPTAINLAVFGPTPYTKYKKIYHPPKERHYNVFWRLDGGPCPRWGTVCICVDICSIVSFSLNKYCFIAFVSNCILGFCSICVLGALKTLYGLCAPAIFCASDVDSFSQSLSRYSLSASILNCSFDFCAGCCAICGDGTCEDIGVAGVAVCEIIFFSELPTYKSLYCTIAGSGLGVFSV